MGKRSIIFIFFCILLVTKELHAQIEGNWVFGVSGGIVRQIGTYNVNLFYTRLPDFPRSFGFDNLRDRGTTFGVFTGYQFGCRGWLFGGEASLDWYNTPHDRFFVFTDARRQLLWDGLERFKRSPTLGLTGRIGFEMAPYFMSYIRLGVATSHDKLTATFSSDTSSIFSSPVVSSTHRWLYRMVIGVGAETPLCFWKGMTLRVEYNYHLPYTRIVTDNFINSFVNPAFTSDVKPKIHLLKGSLVWNA